MIMFLDVTKASIEAKAYVMKAPKHGPKLLWSLRPTSQVTCASISNLVVCLSGVHGRVTDLAQVSQRQYNVAMAMVMGKDMDSVLVDSDKTAKQCIQYLKEQQVPPMTFIPVATVVAKPVNDRLRAMGGSSKLALDLLTYPPAFERAFISICQ